MDRRRFLLLLGAAVPAAVLGCPPAAAAAAPSPAKPMPVASVGPFIRYVDVTVATAFATPGDAQVGVDDAALSVPADLRAWLATLARRTDLATYPHRETQALYGTRVIVDQQVTVGGVLWSRGWFVGQPTPRDTFGYGGYPGWLPDRQLTAAVPAQTTLRARVIGGIDRSASTSPTAGPSGVTAWAYRSAASAVARRASGRVAEFSFGTDFAVAGTGAGMVRVFTNDGSTYVFNALDVEVRPASAAVGRGVVADGATVVRRARAFLGLNYLWAGNSGFGYDCSGFTSALLGSVGVRIPRDADAQALAARDPKQRGAVPTGSATGTWISSMGALRPGDLAFFADATGFIHHVGVFSGVVGGHPMMVNAPNVGQVVSEVALDTGWLAREFIGGGRFLTS